MTVHVHVDAFLRHDPFPDVGRGPWLARASLKSQRTFSARGMSPAAALHGLAGMLNDAMGGSGAPLAVHLNILSIRFPKERGGVPPGPISDEG